MIRVDIAAALAALGGVGAAFRATELEHGGAAFVYLGRDRAPEHLSEARRRLERSGLSVFTAGHSLFVETSAKPLLSYGLGPWSPSFYEPAAPAVRRAA